MLKKSIFTILLLTGVSWAQMITIGGEFLRNPGNIRNFISGELMLDSQPVELYAFACENGFTLFKYPDGPIFTKVLNQPVQDLMFDENDLLILTSSFFARYKVEYENNYLGLTLLDSMPVGGFSVAKLNAFGIPVPSTRYAIARGELGVDIYSWDPTSGFNYDNHFNIPAQDLDAMGPYLVIAAADSGFYIVEPNNNNGSVISRIPLYYYNAVGVFTIQNYLFGIVKGRWNTPPILYRINIYSLQNPQSPHLITHSYRLVDMYPLISSAYPYVGVVGINHWWINHKTRDYIPNVTLYRLLPPDSVTVEYTREVDYVTDYKILDYQNAQWTDQRNLYFGGIGKKGSRIVSIPEYIYRGDEILSSSYSLKYMIFDRNGQMYVSKFRGPDNFAFGNRVKSFPFPVVNVTPIKINGEPYALILDSLHSVHLYQVNDDLSAERISSFRLNENLTGPIAGTNLGRIYVVTSGGYLEVFEFESPYSLIDLGSVNLGGSIVDMDFAWGNYPHMIVGLSDSTFKIYEMTDSIYPSLDFSYHVNSPITTVGSCRYFGEVLTMAAATENGKLYWIDAWYGGPEYNLHTDSVGSVLEVATDFEGWGAVLESGVFVYSGWGFYNAHYTAVHVAPEYLVSMGENGIAYILPPLGVDESQQTGTQQHIKILTPVTARLLKLSGLSVPGVIQILDVAGRKRIVRRIEPVESKVILDLGSLDAGVYFIRYIPVSGPAEARRFIKLQ